MIYYPILKLKEMGVDSILLISGKGHAGHFLELLGGGGEWGLKLAYEVQEEAGGIAQALALAEDFIDDHKFVVMLGDNFFEDDLSPVVLAFEHGNQEAVLFLKEVERPESYGVPRFEGEKIVEIVEKPSTAPSSYAVTGCYLYTPEVFKVIKNIQPSVRGELEISAVNQHYVKKGTLSHHVLTGFWGDCGESIDGMMAVARYVQEKSSR